MVKIIGIADLAGSNTIDFGEIVLSEEGVGLVMTWNNYTGLFACIHFFTDLLRIILNHFLTLLLFPGGFHSFYMDTNTDKTIAKEETETTGLYVRTVYYHSDSVSVGAVVGIVMGGLVVVVILVGAWYYFKNLGSQAGSWSGGYQEI